MRTALMALGLISLSVGPAFGSELAVRSSLRSEARPSTGVIPVGISVAASPRPAPRPAPAANASSATPVIAVSAASDTGFYRWVEAFRRKALAPGISARTYDRAFQGVTLDPLVIQRDNNQSEFTKSIWDYLDSAVSPTRVENGREAMRKYASVLNRIQARYGVDKSVIVAIWGMESAYGAHRGKMSIIRSLATLAYEGRRAKFFETQLIDALKIIQHGDVSAADMTGSWAGAMGHTQFIPSSYLAYAVDFRGDGRRDIWSDDPTDALASTAAYLARNGWTPGQPWGVEVELPPGFNYAQTGHGVTKTVRQWAVLGMRPATGGALRDYGKAQILLPAGAHGPAFMVFHNFHVIGTYNTAAAYVIGVSYLAQRIAGGPQIRASWPRGDRALSRSEKKELQVRLTQAGFNTHGVDGMLGPATLSALWAYQRSVGMIPDGYASIDVLRRLR